MSYVFALLVSVFIGSWLARTQDETELKLDSASGVQRQKLYALLFIRVVLGLGTAVVIAVAVTYD